MSVSMKLARIDLPVIITSYNLSWMTINLLDSLRECSYHNIIPVIVDNASRPEEFSVIDKYLAEHFSDVSVYGSIKRNKHIIVNKENLGFVKAVNQGMKFVLNNGYPYFFVLNNDTLVTKDWDKNLLDSLMKPNVGIVGPMTSPPNWRDMPSAKVMIEEQLKYSQVKDNLERWASGLKEGFSGESKDMDFLAFYCVGFKSSMVRDIGFLDEDYGMGLFDDDDYCYRALRDDYKIVLRQDTYVHHYHRSTWIDKGDDYHKMLEANRKVFISKWGFDPWDRLKKDEETNSKNG